MAAAIVQRPSPESDTRPQSLIGLVVLGGRSQLDPVARRQLHCPVAKLRQYRADSSHTDSVQDCGGGRFSISHTVLLTHIGVMQDIQSLCVGCHQAIFDAIMHHLDKMPCPIRSAVQIAFFSRTAHLFPSNSTRNITPSGS